MLPLVEAHLQTLDAAKHTPELYGRMGDDKAVDDAGEFWDDLALGRFLKGVCLRYVAYPVGYCTLRSEIGFLIPILCGRILTRS